MTAKDMSAAISLIEGVERDWEKEVEKAIRSVPPGTPPYIGSSQIYGSGGYNRYFIYRTAATSLSLRMSKRHAMEREEVERARELGVEVD